MDLAEVIDLLKQKADAKHHAGMLRFGIDNNKALGVKIPEVRKLAHRYMHDPIEVNLSTIAQRPAGM